MSSPADLPDFARGCSLAVGLDETLDQAVQGAYNFEDLKARLAPLLGIKGVAALIVKPSVLGGFRRSVDIATLASEHGIQVSRVRHLHPKP